MERNINDWERVASVAVGAALVGLAWRRRQRSIPLAMTGASLMARGIGGVCPVNAAIGRGRRRDDTRTALGGSRGIRVEERVIVNRPADELFAYWRVLPNLAAVMPHIERVDEIDDSRSHWVARGPAGIRVEWDAEIINEVEPELIGWRSLPGSQVASAGSVRFRPLTPDRTEIVVTLQYDPPAGRLGASVAWLFAESPAMQLRDDLRRFKDAFEPGPSAPAFGTGTMM